MSLTRCKGIGYFWAYVKWLIFVQGRPIWVRWYLVILICISLMISEVEHLLFALLAICISSLEECMFKFFAYLKIRFCCCCWVAVVLYLFWVLTPYEIYDLQISSLFHGLPFHAVVCVLWCSEVFHFDVVKFICFSFLLLPVFLVLYPMNHCQIQCREAFPLWFLIRFL